MQPTYFGNWQQPQVPAYQPTQNSGSFMAILVNGEAGANSYPVAAGNTVLLMDFDSKKFWLKSTDSNGIPQPLRTFPFTEEIKKPEVYPPSGVSREEFEALSDKINKLLDELGGSNVQSK